MLSFRNSIVQNHLHFNSFVDMALLRAVLSAVLGILLYFYLNQHKLASEDDNMVLNETYDFIKGKNILRY